MSYINEASINGLANSRDRRCSLRPTLSKAFAALPSMSGACAWPISNPSRSDTYSQGDRKMKRICLFLLAVAGCDCGVRLILRREPAELKVLRHGRTATSAFIASSRRKSRIIKISGGSWRKGEAIIKSRLVPGEYGLGQVPTSVPTGLRKALKDVFVHCQRTSTLPRPGSMTRRLSMLWRVLQGVRIGLLIPRATPHCRRG